MWSREIGIKMIRPAERPTFNPIKVLSLIYGKKTHIGLKMALYSQ
jgi:hypothetical protein